MSVIRVHKTANFTVMSNYHFKEKKMSLKSKGLLSLMLSLPDDWDYSVSGLVTLSSDGKDSINSALKELEKFGYLTRKRLTNSKGQFAGIEYNIYEQPQENPIAEKPIQDKPIQDNPISEKPTQLNTYNINYLKNELYNELNTNEAELAGLYEDYIEMRENIKSPLTEKGLMKLIERCRWLSKNNVKIQKLLLDTAIINNWKNVYLPREQELDKVSKEIADDLRELFYLE